MLTRLVCSPASARYRAFFNQLNGLCSACTTLDAKPLMHETIFQQLLLDMVDAERPVEFRRFQRLMFEAMVHFRRMKEGDLANGFAQLQRLRTTFPPLSPTVRQLGEAMLTPMIAYYYFRIRDFATATYYNQYSVAISSELQASYPVLHLHQIQQQFNLSRIELAQHQYEEALSRLKELIDYLLTGRAPKLTGVWTTAMRAGLAQPIAHNQLLDIINELVFHSLKADELETMIPPIVLAEASLWPGLKKLRIPSPEAAIRTWWQAYQPESDEQQHEFLTGIITLIQQYPLEYDQLKLLLLGRLHYFAAHSEWVSAEHLLLIRRFVNTKLHLSDRLLHHIRTIRSQPTR